MQLVLQQQRLKAAVACQRRHQLQCSDRQAHETHSELRSGSAATESDKGLPQCLHSTGDTHLYPIIMGSLADSPTHKPADDSHHDKQLSVVSETPADDNSQPADQPSQKQQDINEKYHEQHLHVPSFLQPYARLWDSVERGFAKHDYRNTLGRVFLGLVSFGFGVDLVAATAVNVRADEALGTTVYSCFRASCLSFAMGVGSLLFCILIQPTQLFVCLPRLWTRRHAFRWFYYLPGLFGGGYVTLAIYLSKLEGFGSFFAGAVCGQTAMALFVDQVGFLGLFQERKVTLPKYFGLCLIIAGVVLFQNLQAHATLSATAGNIIAGLVTGALIVVQAPLNTRVAKTVDSFLVAVFLSFCIGLCLVLVLLGISAAIEPFRYDESVIEWYAFLGGPLGNLLVAGGAIIPRKVGFSTFYVANVAGQLVFAACIVYLNLFGEGADYPQRWFLIIGVPVAVLGAAIISYENYKSEVGQASVKSEKDQQPQSDEASNQQTRKHTEEYRHPDQHQSPATPTRIQQINTPETSQGRTDSPQEMSNV